MKAAHGHVITRSTSNYALKAGPRSTCARSRRITTMACCCLCEKTVPVEAKKTNESRTQCVTAVLPICLLHALTWGVFTSSP